MSTDKRYIKSWLFLYNRALTIFETWICVVRNLLKSSLVLLAITANNTQADNLNDYYITIEPTLISYKNKQDVGSTGSELVTYPATLTFEYNLDRVNRLKVNLRGIDAQFSAGKNGFGVDTKGYQLTYTWDRKIRLARNFKPWFGGGLVTGFFDQTNRHKTDGDGFVTETFEDKKETVFSVVLNASIDWELTRSWYFDITTLYEIPVTDGLQGFGVGAGIKYRF